jgi:preprotein translocase subunit SecA
MQEVHEDPALASQLSDDPAFDPADPDGGGVATLPRPRTAKTALDRNDPSTWGQGRAQCALPLRLNRCFSRTQGPELKLAVIPDSPKRGGNLPER